jgi:hypothetical protein
MSTRLWLFYPDRFDMCPRCTGGGKERCSICAGTGRERRYSDVSCVSCAGSGERICSQCRGSGSIRKSIRNAGRKRANSFFSRTTSYFPSTSEKRDESPTAEQQLAEHSNRIITELQRSRFLPRSVTQQWIHKIQEIEIHHPLEGLAIIDTLVLDHRLTIEKHRPQRNVYDLAIRETMMFDNEMCNIKQELDALKAILEESLREGRK